MVLVKMRPEDAVPLLLVVTLAFANGANDVPKTIASLLTSGTVTVRPAMFLAIAATLGGGALSVPLTSGLTQAFQGGGFTALDLTEAPQAAVAVAGGAAAWVFGATRLGLPVSTTHALVGSTLALVLALGGADAVGWDSLMYRVLGPLLLGPIAALLISLAVSRALGIALAQRSQKLLGRLHIASALATTAARALNDVPKLVGVALLALPASGTGATQGLAALMALAMALGGALLSWRVLDTLAHKVAHLDAVSGLVANGTSAALVSTASLYSLPLSTTHVTGAALMVQGRRLRFGVVAAILGAWVVTVPGAFLATTLVLTIMSTLVGEA